MSNLTEQQKVKKLYDLIEERGLYVNTNFDVFTQKPEQVALGSGAGSYTIPLAQPGSRAYASPLLFATLTSLTKQGTMLITGAPGIGKTTGAEFAGHFFTGTPLDDILASEIQGHPQLTEEKMVASFDIAQLVSKGVRVVLPNRFLQCPVKILDEGNRTPPDVLSIIMRLVDSGKAVYGGQLLEAQKGPLFVTANYSDEGTFEFTPPFLDRFDVAVMVTSPQSSDLRRIRSRGDEKLNGGIESRLVIPDELRLDFDRIRREIKDLPEQTDDSVSVVSTFADFYYARNRFSEVASDNLARATKGNAWRLSQENATPGHFVDDSSMYTVNELSIRTVKAMDRYARAYAWLNGKSRVELDDLKTVLPYLLWHKVTLTAKALAENEKHANDRIAFVEALTSKIENEFSDLQGSNELKVYTVAMDILRTGKHKGKELNPEELRKVVKTAITKIGEADKTYALEMTSHIAVEYNRRIYGGVQK